VLDNLWLGSEEGESVAAALVPKLEKTKEAVEQVCVCVGGRTGGRGEGRRLYCCGCGSKGRWGWGVCRGVAEESVSAAGGCLLP
jgi:hypothetical protein